jgi:predicted metal-dependent HD superfamily phosphohydrolase
MSIDPLLLRSWNRVWGALAPSHTPPPTALLHQVVAAYSEPQRYYHNLQHLQECLNLFGQHHHSAQDPACVELALWFHDAVYDPRAQDNEVRSADWAESALREARVAETTVGKVRDLILATRHTEIPQSPDKQLIVDIDLAILGASPERFAEYELQIRAEYAWVPEAEFRQKRGAILQSFLNHHPIYHTPSIREQREQPARRNLAQAIKTLLPSPEATNQ